MELYDSLKLYRIISLLHFHSPERVLRKHSLRCNRDKFSSLSNEEGRSTRATTPNKCPITESWPVIMRLSQPHPHSTSLINITLYLPNTLPDRCSELWTCPSDTEATRGAGERTVGDARTVHPLVLNTLHFLQN